MRSFRIYYLVALVFLQVVSCTPESCFEQTIAKIKAPLYLNSTKKIQSPDSLTLYGLNKQSNKIYDKAKNVNMALMPLNPSAKSSGFIIRINRITDTILIWYTSYPHLISRECGYTYYYTLDSLVFTYNIIDTIEIRNRFVTTINEENIRILY